MKRALIVQGGWDGHQPREVSVILANLLQQEGFEVEVSDTLDALCDGEKLKQLDLIVPLWTMGTIRKDQLEPLLEAVKSGVGIGGLHGGMGDAFRNETEFQYMVGGQWVAHPGNDGVTYEVEIVDREDSLFDSVPKKFTVVSEQYYMHVDPAVEVYAITRFGKVEMPVAWTKYYGAGRVFYCSLGHQANIVEMPETLEMMRRGLLWAAEREVPAAV
jgi:type 1 glutamine amidotransferase